LKINDGLICAPSMNRLLSISDNLSLQQKLFMFLACLLTHDRRLRLHISKQEAMNINTDLQINFVCVYLLTNHWFSEQLADSDDPQCIGKRDMPSILAEYVPDLQDQADDRVIRGVANWIEQRIEERNKNVIQLLVKGLQLLFEAAGVSSSLAGRRLSHVLCRSRG